MIIDIEKYQSVLCLDGELPFAFLRSSTLPLIAADGAANTLVAQGCDPSCIVGDLDSVEPALLARYPHVRDTSQETTDFEKALAYLEKKSLLPTIVVGMSGGHCDRILANITFFSQSSVLRDALFLSEELMGFVLTQTQTFSWPINTKLSLFGCPQGVVTSQGLRWELNKFSLTLGGACSCSNRVQTSPLTLQVEQGAVLVFVYRNPVRDAGSL